MLLTLVTGLPKGSYTRRVVGRALADRELFLRQVIETSHRHTIEDFVLAGIGPGLIIEAEGGGLAARGAVVRDVVPAIEQPFFLIHPRKRLSKAAELFVSVSKLVWEAPSVSRRGDKEE